MPPIFQRRPRTCRQVPVYVQQRGDALSCDGRRRPSNTEKKRTSERISRQTVCGAGATTCFRSTLKAQQLIARMSKHTRGG
ncbi:hypothetical protein F2P81_005323 [Scophthalmus maximus]|uniref:Uncharacterized protein n=1 Tax=Scophthalmus maximus TaxID=52904 RepID=A0A6A4TG02_SCOMX|nr:hypothetical protein F2P81_005323 [Scophthalmus maximus]